MENKIEHTEAETKAAAAATTAEAAKAVTAPTTSAPAAAPERHAALVAGGENMQLIRQAYKQYLPITILLSLSSAVGLMINNVVAGNLLGSDAVAAIGLASPLLILFGGFAGMLEAGSVALCARALGRRDTGLVNTYYSVTILATFAVGIILGVACFAAADPIALALTAGDAGLLPLVSAYVQGLGFCAIFVILFQVMLGFLRLDNASGIGVAAIAVMCICTIAFNVLAVSVMDLGLFGIGASTALAYAVGLLACLFHAASKRNSFRFGIPEHKGKIVDVFATGSPNALARVCGLLRTLIFNYLLLMVAGPAAVAALSIIATLSSLLTSGTIGVGQTGGLLAGIFFGEEDRSAIRASIKTGIRYGLVLCFVFALVLVVFAEPILHGFGIYEGQAFEYGLTGVRIFGISLPIGMISVIFINYYQGIGSIKAALAITVSQYFAFTVLSALVLAQVFGVTGVWLAFVVGDICGVLVFFLAVHVLWKRRQRKHGLPETTDDGMLDKMLYFPLDFQKDWKASASFSCNDSLESVVECSRRIEAFCLENGIEARRAYQLSLAVEEMAGNIVEHGFAWQKHPAIEVKAVVKDSGILLRIRDNGALFNPLNYDLDRQDPFSGIGIKMVRNTMHDIDYHNNMGFNNLVISL